MNLHNKKVVLIGATGGIGSAITDLFLEKNADLVLVGRNESLLSKISNNYHICDLDNIDAVRNLLPIIEEKFGQIDVLICNAGITRDALFMRLKEEYWDEVIKINLKTTFLLNQQAVKTMVRRKHGKIINISSIVGITGNIGQANYSASKAGIIAMTKSIALEVASRNIVVNCIAPGYIKTQMTEKLGDEIKNIILEKIPMKRMGLPIDVANTALFLSSDYSSYITGQTISVNGGLYM